MPTPKLSDAEFIALWRKLGTTGMVKEGHGDYSNIGKRRRRIERRHRISLVAPHHPEHYPQVSEHPGRINLEIDSGVVIVGGDLHAWPGPTPTAMRAFIKFCKDLKPRAVIANGDMVDMARVSRHSPIQWEKSPTVIEEIEAAQDQMHQLAAAAGRARKLWPQGNHDARFESFLHANAREYAKVHGTRLKDHFSLWEPCWSVHIKASNSTNVVVKHRWKGGVHGAHNNAVGSGVTMVTGHDHALRVSPYTDYNGTRWGVSAGCLADPDARAFLAYTEDSPKNWRAGFSILTFHKGRLLWPEIVSVIDASSVEFRGEIIKV